MNHSSNRVIMFSLYYVCVSVCVCENGAFGGYTLGTEVGRYNKKEAPKIILSPLPNQHPSIFLFPGETTYLYLPVPTYLPSSKHVLPLNHPHPPRRHGPHHGPRPGTTLPRPHASRRSRHRGRRTDFQCYLRYQSPLVFQQGPSQSGSTAGYKGSALHLHCKFLFFFLFSSPHVVGGKIVLGVVKLFADFFSLFFLLGVLLSHLLGLLSVGEGGKGEGA